MATKNYVIINDSNEIIVNNAYGELKQLYKQNYRTNDLLALKALVKSIENGILDEIDLQPENHQGLIDIINGQTYSEDTLRSFDIYPEDMMFDTNYTVNFDGLHNLLTSILGESNNTFTSKHANECVKVSAHIDNIITDMFKKNAKNLSREEELKVTIANILSKEQKFDTSKYDVNALSKTFTTDQISVNKVKSKIVGVFKKIDNGSTSGDTYVINVGGYNADQRTINALAKDINNLYRSLYKKDDYQIAAAYASIISDLVNNYSDYAGGDKLTYIQNLVNNVDESIRDRVADKVNALADSLDNEYVYTDEDKAAVNSINEAAQAKLAEVEQHNEEVNAEIATKQAEYDAAVAAYPENHNGDEYSGTIITNPGKTIRPSEDKTNELNNTAAKHIPKMVNLVHLSCDNTNIYYPNDLERTINIEYDLTDAHTIDELNIDKLIIKSSGDGRDFDVIEKTLTSVTVRYILDMFFGEPSITVYYDNDGDGDDNDDLTRDTIIFTVQEGEEPEKYYFGAFHESIIENGAFNFNGLELTTEDEFFNESTDDYKFRTVISAYPNFIKYVLVPNDYLNNLTVQDTATHSSFVTNHAFTDGSYTLLDYTGWNEGNGIVANFEIKVGGSSVDENTVIETLEPGPQPQDGVYWYVGLTQPTTDNYKSIATAVSSYNSSYEYTPESRGYVYVLVTDDKNITIVDPSLNATVDTTVDTSIAGYKVYTSAIKLSARVIINVN